jgi:hypothetical protein
MRARSAAHAALAASAIAAAPAAAATARLSYAQGSPIDDSVSLVDDKLGAVVSTSIFAGSSGARECVDADANYCHIQYTGPLSFNLKP